MTDNPRLGIAFAFVCLVLVGLLPILASARPDGVDGLTFTVWLNLWQLVVALPLFLRERLAGKRGLFPALPRHSLRGPMITIVTGAIFGVSTYMFVVAAEKAGPVDLAIALQAYPLFAIGLEAIFLGKRKSAAELGFTALMIAALLYLTTNGTLLFSQLSWWSVFALGIPFLWAVAHVLLRQILTTTPVTANQVTVTRLLISGAFLLLLDLAVGSPAALAAAVTDGAFQKAAILLGLAYYLELIFWFKAIRHIDVSVASTVIVPSPAVTMLAALAFTGATIALHQILAMATITVAMYGLLWAGKRARLAA